MLGNNIVYIYNINIYFKAILKTTTEHFIYSPLLAKAGSSHAESENAIPATQPFTFDQSY